MRSLLQTFTVVSSPPFPMSSLSIVLTINSVLTVLHPLSWVAHQEYLAIHHILSNLVANGSSKTHACTWQQHPLCVSRRGLAGWPGRLPQPSPHACSPSSPSRQASLSCRSRGRVGLEPHPPHTAATPTAAKAGLHSPRHDHLAGQSRVKTPPPRPLPRSEVAVGMSYSLLWPPSEPTFSQTGS